MKKLLGLVTLLGLCVGAVLSQEPQIPLPQPKVRDFPKSLITPAEAVKYALADIQTIPDEDQRCVTRYLTLYNIHPDDRAAYIKLLNFALNSLSRKRVITTVGVVPGSENAVLQVNLSSYAIDPTSWDNLAAKGSGPVRSVKKVDMPEPYFHMISKKTHTPKVSKTEQVTVTDQRTGQKYLQEKKVEVDGTPVEKVEIVHGPWIDQADITALALASKTDYPILRGDWFIANALITPAYYELLGLKTFEDYAKLVRFREQDEDLAEKGVVTVSTEVAHNIRAARFVPTSQGYSWETYDFLTSVGESDLLINLLNDKRDAGEYIATLPNSLQVYLLTDGNKKLVDFADPNVATDTFTGWRNKLVWSGVSCMTCHNEGLKDVTDEVRVLSQPPVGLLAKKKKDFEKVVDLFSSPIHETLAKHKLVYSTAVAKSTGGLTTKANAAFLEKAFVGYHQNTLDLNTAAMEVGCKPDELKAIILKAVNPDHTLTQLVVGRPVRRDQWEAVGYGQLCILTRTLTLKKPE